MAGTLPHTWKRALLKACFSNSLCSHHPWAGLNRVLIFHLSRFLSPNFLLSRGASSSSTMYVLHSRVTVVVALAAEPGNTLRVTPGSQPLLDSWQGSGAYSLRALSPSVFCKLEWWKTKKKKTKTPQQIVPRYLIHSANCCSMEQKRHTHNHGLINNVNVYLKNVNSTNQYGKTEPT